MGGIHLKRLFALAACSGPFTGHDGHSLAVVVRQYGRLGDKNRGSRNDDLGEGGVKAPWHAQMVQDAAVQGKAIITGVPRNPD
jgi:hypothetical protein